MLDPSKPIERPTDVPSPSLHWTLGTGGADATARADLLDFLRVLHQGCQLEVINSDRELSVGTLDAPGAPFDADLAGDLAFLSDVATLEEWAGMVLPLPTEVAAADVARITQAATMVRAREIAVSRAGDIEATMPRDVADLDELELEQDFGVSVFGFDVPLGVGRVRLAVVVGDIEPLPGQPELVRVALRPVAADLIFALTPPDGREAYKWTLESGEAPSPGTDSAWPEDWMTREHAVSRELRTGQGIRFVTESAFFEWLAHPDVTASS